MSADNAKVKKGALRVGLTVAGASAAVLALLGAVAVAYVAGVSRIDPAFEERRGIHQGHNPGHRGPGHLPRYFEDRIVDVGDLVPVLLLLGILGVIFLGVIAWLASKQSTKPLEHALRVQRAFVADASHELRTPLTTLNSRIQLARHRYERGGDVEDALNAAQQDAQIMNDVLTDLLLAAESAADDPRGKNKASVQQCVEEAVRIVEPRAKAKHVVLSYQVAAPHPHYLENQNSVGLHAAIDPTALTRALVILLDNAVAHSPAHPTDAAPEATPAVTVIATEHQRQVQIRVQDQGAGISGLPTEEIFDRFARADHGRQRGFGLGLALVSDVADRFGGEVSVETTGPLGTTFLLVLPAA